MKENRSELVLVVGLIGIGVIIGIGYTLYLFPRDFLDGSANWWVQARTEDVRTAITGMRYFIGDDWLFPLFRTTKINPPQGIAIIYTDSIPFLALIAKSIRQIFGAHWNYFGIWIGAAYTLQAVSVVVLLLSLSVRNFLACAAGAVIALSAPTFLFRLFHTSLVGHFLVVFALSLYFFSTRSSSFHRIWPWFASLMWLGLWINAYFFVLVFSIFLAAAVQFSFSRQEAWKQGAFAVGICLSGSLCLMWLSGYFWGSGQAASSGGFGHYSMNLLSPWVPQWSGLFPGLSKIFGATRSWGKLIIDATGGQYEGYNYLGAGILLLFCVALWLERSRVVYLAKKYWCLVFVLLGLTVMALSNRVYIGRWEFVVFEEVPPFFNQIRSSGRLFWPVVYTILAGSVAVVSLRTPPRVATVLLLIAATLQVADATPIRNWVAKVHEEDKEITSADIWRNVISAHDRLIILPTFPCKSPSRGEVFWKIVNLSFIASESLTPINTAYLNRLPRADCVDEAKRALALEPAEGDLLILLRPYSEAVLSLRSTQMDLDKICRSFDQSLVCSRRWNQIGDLDSSFLFTPPNVPIDSYRLGTFINFSQGGNSTQYGAFGWGKPESEGAWSYSSVAGLALRIEKGVTSDLTIIAETSAFVTQRLPQQKTEISVNGKVVGSWTFKLGEPDMERRLTIPAKIAARQSPMHISFYFPDAKSPIDLELKNTDSRRLGLRMRSMVIVGVEGFENFR